MSSKSNQWRYSPGLPEPRLQALTRFGSFRELAAAVSEEVRVIRAIAERGHEDGLTGCHQPVFFIELASTGDALFNGPFGYRAQYWRDPWQGLMANAMLIELLKPRLMATAASGYEGKLSKMDICASLGALSAKIWIREAPCILDGKRELNVEPWVSEAARGVELAVQGTTAPQVSKFEVKGALLDAFGHEHIPVRKLRRHHEIHRYGFS